MTIAPIVRSTTVKAAPDKAFERFTRHMAKWWPPHYQIGGAPFQEIVLEPRVGGRWLERDADGNEASWGKVLVWEPPARVVLAWQLTSQFKFDPDFETELEITFEPAGTGTRVTLEHRNLERYGADAARMREMLDSGWPSVVQLFASFADNGEAA